MAVSVYDNSGNHYLVGEGLSHNLIVQPIVTERKDTLSFPFGDAEMTHIAFSGIYIIYGDMVMKDQRTLYFDMVDEHEMVELHFTLSGEGTMKNNVSGNQFVFKTNEFNMHFVPHFSGSLNYNHQDRYKFLEIHFTRNFFLELARDSNTSLIQFAESISGNVKEIHRENLQISFEMHQCIRDIMNCKFTGGLKLLYLQSKCIELLAMQGQAYEDLANRKSIAQVCKSAYDLERIHFAKEYLLKNAITPPSLSELAKVAGVNEFKLKSGFKEVFDNTVFGYLNDYKLQQAKELLLMGNSIKSVADDMGYSSVQHFSTAFRKKYNVPPGKLKK
ncbi:MAG: AraC family transcriptional regulator [Chitinophagaceae bacterium]|jgi:AraC-like DNA-binding protein